MYMDVVCKGAMGATALAPHSSLRIGLEITWQMIDLRSSDLDEILQKKYSENIFE